MASTSTLLKRPHPDGDDLPDPSKRSRSNDGSPAPQPASSHGTTAAPKVDAAAFVAQAKARAAAIAARLQGGHAASTTSPSTAAAGASPGGGVSQSVQDRIAAMRARVAAATNKASSPAGQSPRPVAPLYQVPTFDDGMPRARGGLDVGLHPALMDSADQDSRSSKSRQAMQPKFATTMANRRVESPLSSGKGIKQPKNQLDLSGPSLEELRANPYYDVGLGTRSGNRSSRQLLFNQKGKYIAQAAGLRRQAALEAMKKRIAESARKAGIDEDIDAEKGFLVEAPPEIEWWDEGLVSNGKNYADISAADPTAGAKIGDSESIVTKYIQHPVALEPPQEKHAPAPKPLPLTAQEQAKKRRQERMANLKEQQAKIRLGLEPAPAPKVKKANMMRVLGEEAVKDPTAVEARVNREIAERKQTHEQQNEARRLTQAERAERVAGKQAGDAARGIFAAVYRIESLANGRHRFKIGRNAEQMALTGACVLHPRFCLVFVEGGHKSVADYKKLMLQRIDWTANAAPTSGGAEAAKADDPLLAEWMRAEDEAGRLKDLSGNRCRLIWEGQEERRAFRKWMSSKPAATDKEAREFLLRHRQDAFWTLAKNWPDDAE